MASRRAFAVGSLAILSLAGTAGCASLRSNAAGERVWTGEIPAGDTPARRVVLTALADGRATLTQTAADGTAPVTQSGAWIEDGPLLQVRLAEPGSPRTVDRLIWHVEGERLVPREWDRLIWGLDGVTMTRQP